MRQLSLIRFFTLIMSGSLQAENLVSQIETAINQSLPDATVSVVVKDAVTNKFLYTKNADKLLSPASNMKLFTAAAALYYWQPNHRFYTRLLKDKSNIYLYFGGSPSLTSNNLMNLVLQLKQQNIQEIHGNFIIDTSRFKPPYYPAGVSYDDLGWYYSAPDPAVILNKNTVTYKLITPEELGSQPTLEAKQANNGLTILNQLTIVNKKEEKQHCGTHIETQPNNTLRLYGCVAYQKEPKFLELAIPNPLLLAQQIVAKTLAEQHINLHGKITEGTIPKTAQELARLESHPLTQLIYHMLQESDNLYADNLTRQLAYALTQDATPKQAAFALKTILKKHTHLDMKQMELADGIGTRYNLVTANQLSTLLADIYNNKPMYNLFLKSLPISGTSGTLKERMKNTLLEKKVYAKTGSMHDISSLSGYMIYDEHPIIFSIIINGINQPANKAKALEEEILLIVAKELFGEASTGFA